MNKCTICVDYNKKTEKCYNRNSQYYDDFVNEYMICREFSEDKDEHKTIKKN